MTAAAVRASRVKNALTLRRSPTIAHRNNRDVKTIRNILAGLALASLAACGGGSADQPTPTPVQQQSPPISNVVAFMGDSITAKWDISQNDPAPTINFGVNSQTCVQMLARFDAVLAAAPGVVVITCGTNDLQVYGPTGASIDSTREMAAMAAAAGIRVIIGSVIPHAIADGLLYTNADAVAFNEKLITLAQEGYLYADYNNAFLNPDGAVNDSLYILNPDGSVFDGTHPGPAGYAVMWSVLAPLLQEDLQ